MRRHRERDLASRFGEADMRDWYRPGDVLGYDFERVIAEASTLPETVELIRSLTA